MDPIALVALLLFVALVAAWFVLPGAAATGVSDQDPEAIGVPTAQRIA